MRSDFMELPDGTRSWTAVSRSKSSRRASASNHPGRKIRNPGGFILHLIRKIPLTGDVIRHDELEMVIASADERSIKKVKIRKMGETSPLKL